MELLNPGALWLLPLIGILILLARLRPEPLRRAIANVHLWAGAALDERSLAASARPRFNLLLVLQVAFALLVIGALTHPLLPWTDREVAIVVDISASMDARDDVGTRLDVARERALALASSLPQSARVRLVGAAASPVDLGRFRAGDAALRRAIADVKTAAGAADLEEAIQFARGGDVFVLSDQPAQPHTGVRWVQVGHPVDNLAVTALAARRTAMGTAGGALLAEISNYGAADRDADVVFKHDGREFARRSVRIAARKATAVAVDVPDAGGTFSAELAGNRDALAADDRRFAVARPAGRIHVRLASPGGQFVERALEANPDVTVDSAGAGNTDVVVCGGCRELPPGNTNVLMVAPPETASAPSGPLTVGVSTHSLMDGVDVAGLVARAVPSAGVLSNGPSTIVLRAGNQPALVAGERNGRRVAELNVGLAVDAGAGSNFALTPAFPILLANLVDWLATPRPQSPDPNALNPATETESDLRAFAAAPSGFPVDASSTARAGGVTDLFVTLIALALVVLAVESWYTLRRHAGWTSAAWRIAVAALLGGAAAGLAIPIGAGSATVVVALDRSDSVGAAAFRSGLSRINDFAAGMRDNDRLGVVVFGGDAAIERRPASRAAVSGVRSAVTHSGTNIEAALRLARTALPAAGMRRIVLVSDGRETSGDMRREAARAAAAGVHIDVLPSDPAGAPGDAAPLTVTNVVAPAEAREGEPFEVSVSIAGPAGSRGRVMVFRNGAMLASQEFRTGPDGTAGFSTTDSSGESGHVVYTAAVDGDDGDRPGTVVTVSGQSRALYVGGGQSAVASAIESSGIRVARVSAINVPETARTLSAYDLLVLDAVAADQLTAAQADAIASYVDGGGGLLVLGSTATLTAASLAGNRLGAVLPIDLRPRGGRRAPSTSFVFVFDKSGSMADRENGVQKIELARQAVLRVLDVRPSSDPFGVIAFDSAPTVVAPLEAGRDAASVAERLRAIEPGGATAIAPAMDVALRWLAAARTPTRHVLLVSDGRTTAADAGRLRASIAGRGVDVSVVAIGPDADRDFLDRLARSTGGRAYFAADIRELPALAARDATAAAGGTQLEEPFTVRASSHPAVAGIDRGTLPQLRGYIVSALKPGSEPLLLSHLDDPVLAGWRYGLGRAAVFTSDLRSTWAASMTAWPAFRQLWVQTARWTGRSSANRVLNLMVVDRTGGPHLTVEAERPGGGFANALDLDAAVRSPSGGTELVRLRATAPGRYEADLPTASAGVYVVHVAGRDRDTGGEERAVRAFYWSADRERFSRGTDSTMLAEIARLSGGEVLMGAANPFTHARPWERRDISSWLGVAALIVFLVDLARRRRALAALARWWRSRGIDRSPLPAHA